jgi:hypothetical protein
MVLTRNLTLAQAWGILDLARTNKSGNVRAFPFFATDEFYTLGFSWRGGRRFVQGQDSGPMHKRLYRTDSLEHRWHRAPSM